MDSPARSGATSAVLADRIAGSLTSPTKAAVREEVREHLLECLEKMNETDREILALRHFEQLTNTEAAYELGLDVSTTSKRYARALVRLKKALGPRAAELE